MQQAYPSVDIIINAIPPIGRQHAGEHLTQTQIDQFNQAIVQMCEAHDWKFLNSAEVLKDPETGYARDGYVIQSDGIHLTEEAIGVLFDYIRTHSYITEDDRPALTDIPEHLSDKDVSATTAATVITSQPSAPTAAPSSEAPEPTQEPTPSRRRRKLNTPIGVRSSSRPAPSRAIRSITATRTPGSTIPTIMWKHSAIPSPTPAASATAAARSSPK